MLSVILFFICFSEYLRGCGLDTGHVVEDPLQSFANDLVDIADWFLKTIDVDGSNPVGGALIENWLWSAICLKNLEDHKVRGA